MNFIIPFLMLFIPGAVAVSIHHKQMIHVTRENWQSTLWEYLFYSFAIVIAVNFVMYLSYPQRSISYSSFVIWTTSNILYASFVVKYSLFALSAAVGLPKLWENRENIYKWWKNRKQTKLGDDE